MVILHPMAAVFVLFGIAATASAQPVIIPTWTRQIVEREQLLGVEERGRCLVLKVGGAIHVLRPSGELWWSWPYLKVSRFIKPTRAAISHACDAIAVPGHPGYKYTWIVQRGGKAVAMKTLSVPADAAFDRSGQVVAVGTFGRILYLYSRNGELKWKRAAEGAAILHGLHFSDDNRRIIFTGWAGAGVATIDGTIEWASLANRLAFSRDLSTFVFGHEPNHGPGFPSFSVTDAMRTTTLFHRRGDVDTFVSASGHRILANVHSDPLKEEADLPGTGQGVQLLTRRGDHVTSKPNYDAPVALSEDGQRMWLRSKERFDCVDDKGTVLATIAINVGQRPGDDDRPWFQTFVARGFEQIVVSTNYDGRTTLARYAVPSGCRD